MADYLESYLLQNYAVTRSQDLAVLNLEDLSAFDLILPHWTYGELTASQEHALLDAVSNGLGYFGLHGNASAFLNSRLHKLLLGGQFVAHLGGDQIDYQINFQRSDPMTCDLQDFNVKSEQYYLLMDSSIDVLATTRIDGGEMSWLKNTLMPVAWKRKWGLGKVFYCTLGHCTDDLTDKNLILLLKRALKWTIRELSISNDKA